jgi:hypothetical protein
MKSTFADPLFYVAIWTIIGLSIFFDCGGYRQGYIDAVRDMKDGREMKFILVENKITGEMLWKLNDKYKER